ncbi:MAG: hypothetical protein WB682_11265, partial [Candidatus Dormiibacterota bacterium]
YFWDATHTAAGPVRQLGSPMRFSRTPARREKAAPMLGEDTQDVLSEIGYADDAIAQLVGRNVIGVSEARRIRE